MLDVLVRSETVKAVLLYLAADSGHPVTVRRVATALSGHWSPVVITDAVDDARRAGLVTVISPAAESDAMAMAKVGITGDGIAALGVSRRDASPMEEIGALWRAGKYAHCPICGTRNPRLPG